MVSIGYAHLNIGTALNSICEEKDGRAFSDYVRQPSPRLCKNWNRYVNGP